MIHDYTRKHGIVHSEILLPPNAPPDFQDRGTLWNSVEQIEKACNSQLARELEVALPIELVYTVTGSYDGVETLDKKMERIMGEKFTEKMEDSE